jgi:hypothetical protein
MLVAISMVDAAPARGDVHARMQVSPGECNGHLGGHTEFINGRLVERSDFVPWHLASFRCDAEFGRYRRHSGHGWTCRWVAPVANDPIRTRRPANYAGLID